MSASSERVGTGCVGAIAIWLAVVLHGPAGAILKDAMRRMDGVDPVVAIGAGVLWLASGIVLLLAALSCAWYLGQLWRRMRP